MKIRKNIAISENGFIFNPLTGDSFSINETGVAILQQLKDGVKSEDIVIFMMNEYEIDKHSAEKDLTDYLSMLKSYQLTENE